MEIKQCVFIDLTNKRCNKICKSKLCEKHERITANRKLILEIVEDKIKRKDIDEIVYNL